MDIRNWPMDRIMQLPDEAFGRRFSIVISGQVANFTIEYFLSDISLPDRCVLFESFLDSTIFATGFSSGVMQATISLSHNLVDNDPDFLLLENLLTGVNEIVTLFRIVRPPCHMGRLKLPVLAQGRKVAVRVINPSVAQIEFTLCLVFASIPREIPDWMVGSESKQLEEIIRLLRVGAKLPVENPDVSG